jgi:hypothetical protein
MVRADFPTDDGTISALADQLRWETEPGRRDGLKRILIKEEDRFAGIIDRLRLIERELNKGAALIARQRRLIDQIRIRGEDASRAQCTLERMEITQDLFEEFRTLLFYARERLAP